MLSKLNKIVEDEKKNLIYETEVSEKKQVWANWSFIYSEKNFIKVLNNFYIL